MPVLPLLAQPDRYRPCTADLLADRVARDYWLNVFQTHFEIQLEAAVHTGTEQTAVERARQSLRHALNDLRDRPDHHGRLDILLLDELRQRALAAGGITDEFRDVKHRANEAALTALPRRLGELDALHGRDLIEALACGLLAGNLFDMGAKAAVERLAARHASFDEALALLPPRPWLRDDLDPFADWLVVRSAARAVILVDNAGPDIVLGVLPFTRFLIRAGADVILAANDTPSLNDVTAAELESLLDRARSIDAVFASPRLTVIASGCRAPLIDLAAISPALADVAADADFLVLIGMGRAVESNWSADFTCPCLRIATLKDPHVAAGLGGRLFDAVVRFDRP